MREIKFRAFVDNKMYKVVGLDLWSDSVSEHTFTIWDDDLDDSIELDTTEFGLMQYTGLKDKNGKEIYEGDIVKYNYNNQVYQDVYAKVEYSIAGFRLNADYISRHLSRHIRIANTDYYEVVGNIYENPELLEVQDD